MLARRYGDLELGADTVGGRDQNRVAITRSLQVEQRTETAQAGGRTATRGACRERFDRFDEGRPRIDIDAGIAITAGVYGVLRGDGL
jgi:hypothetical protein